MGKSEFTQVSVDIDVANRFQMLVLQLYKTLYRTKKEQATFALDQHCMVLTKIIKQREIDGEMDHPPPTERDLLIFIHGDEVPDKPPDELEKGED